MHILNTIHPHHISTDRSSQTKIPQNPPRQFRKPPKRPENSNDATTAVFAPICGYASPSIEPHRNSAKKIQKKRIAKQNAARTSVTIPNPGKVHLGPGINFEYFRSDVTPRLIGRRLIIRRVIDATMIFCSNPFHFEIHPLVMDEHLG